ncbi:MAG: ankyrin repeat domain-containing protein [Gemmatimonadota bacterium]
MIPVPVRTVASTTPVSRSRRARGTRRSVLGLALMLGLLGLVAPDTPVADAAAVGDLERLRLLLRDGADVNAAQGDGMTALHWAAERGDSAMAAVLLYAGADVDAGTRIGRYTPLHVAAGRGDPTLVRVLLRAGASAQARTTTGGTQPLHLAAGAGDPDAVEALLEAGVTVDVREGAWGQTPLIFAAARNRVDVIHALLAAGADPDLASVPVDVVEWEAADRAAERRLRQVLAEFKEREGGGTDWQPTPAQVQAALEVYREVQRRWPDVPDPADDDKPSAPDSAAADSLAGPDSLAAGDSASADSARASAAPAGGPEEAADAPSGSDPREGPTDAEGAPPADSAGMPDTAAAEEPRPLTYAQLVGGWGGLTPLHHAVRQGHTAAALALLEGGADLDRPSVGDGTTPLLMAAVNGQFDLALLLLERGADPTLASTAGTTPLFAVLERTWAPRASYAHPTEHQQQRATHLDVMRALLEAGADPNARLTTHLWYMEYTFSVLGGSGINLQGATPFWRAAYALDVDAMRLLKAYGADPDIPTTKPPERRRRAQADEEDEVADSTAAADSIGTGDAVVAGGDSAAVAATPANAEGLPVAAPPAPANAEGEGSAPGEDPEDEEEDHSGVPPVPVGGPAIFPIHAASGVGYGQSFAGNAHRHVPDNWLAAVRFLVEECGADVNVRDANAYTALHHAASRGDNAVVQYLVDHGADVTVVSRKGQTTADMANGPIERVQPFPETVELLERLGATNNHTCVSC